MTSAQQYGWGWPKGSGTTTNAQKVVIATSDVVPNDTTLFILATLIGKTSAGKSIVIRFEHQAKTTGNVLSLLGSLQQLVANLGRSDTELLGCSGAIEISGGALTLTVTGVLGQTVEWMGDMFIRVH